MRSKIVPNEQPIEIGAGDIVCLNIRTNVVTKVVEDIVGGANGTQTSDSALRTLNNSANMCRQSRIPHLDGKDDGHLDAKRLLSLCQPFHFSSCCSRYQTG